jgi:MFS family permease
MRLSFSVGVLGSEDRRRRSFKWFLASAFASAIGRNAYQIACAWILVVAGQGSLAVAAFFAIVSVVELFVSPVAGWLADRYDRRALYLTADAIRFVGASVMAILLVSTGSLWLIWVSAALFAVFDRIALTASQCMIPAVGIGLTSATANSAVFFLLQSGSLCAASLVGFLLHALPPSITFATMAMAFAVSVLCMLFVKREPVCIRSGSQTQCEPLVIDVHLLHLAAVYALLYTGGMLVSVVGPSLVFDELKGNALDFGHLESAWSAGSILGVVLLVPFVRAAKISALQLGVLILTASFFAILKVLTLPSIFVAFAILGVLYNLGRVGVEVTLQSLVGKGALGRAKGFIHCGAVSLGLLLFGAIAISAAQVPPSTVFLVYGVFLATAALLLGFYRPGGQPADALRKD